MLSLVLVFGGAIVAPARGTELRDTAPNVVLILADDLGLGDPRCFNNASRIPTPTLDRLAAEGTAFTDMHSPSSVCTPTRYGVLCGRYAWRTRLKSGVLTGWSPLLIDPERPTIASVLRAAGYATAAVGKWHLGFGSQPSVDYDAPLRPGPLDLGFDRFQGIPSSLDFPPYVWVTDDRVETAATATVEGSKHRRQGGGGFWRAGPIAPDFAFDAVLPRIGAEAVAWLRERAAAPNRATPFFLYVPLSAPHTPWLPADEYRGASAAGYYGDFVAQVDATIGRVVDTLDELALADDTLVIVTSDNGAHWPDADIATFEHDANAGYRGQKADIWEGGHRVPFLVRWPERVPAGAVRSELGCLTDLFRTIATIADAPLPAGAAEDSVDLSALFLGAEDVEPPRTSVVHHSLNGTFAIRAGRWKLIRGLGSGGFTDPKRKPTEPGGAAGQLYDLDADPGETVNRFRERPDVVARLTRLLHGIREPRRAAGGDEGFDDLALHYDEPAARWEEALPVGNGRLGAMVFGGTDRERLALNEDTIWAGRPEPRDRAGAHAHLAAARALAFDGRFVDAQARMQAEFLSPRMIRSYQPLGDLQLDFGALGPVSDFERRLDLDRGIATTRFTAGGVRHVRRVFASAPDDVVVVELATEPPGALAFDLRFDRPRGARASYRDDGTAVLAGQAWHPDSVDPRALHADALGALARGADYWPTVAGRDAGWRDGWFEPDCEDGDWPTIAVPGPWEDALGARDGFVWFRRAIEIPDAWIGRDLVLSLGAIDDGDHTWFDGAPVGDTIDAWDEPRRYAVAAKNVRDRVANVTVLAFDLGGGGGFRGAPGELFLAPADAPDERLSLAGDWRIRYAPDPVPDDPAGVRFEGRLAVDAPGATITADERGLRIEGAERATIRLAASTDYRGELDRAERTLAAARARSADAIERDHVREHRRLFRRVALDLGGHERRTDATDERLARVQAGEPDPDLVALYFQYGRYLLISCSRPGAMPANLQGLWNPHLEAPWNSDYHININCQMNYWPAEVTNLAECHEPFFDLVDGLRDRGRRTARELYDAGGWVAHHTTDAWWFTAPTGRTVWGLWPTGGAWCTRHLWEHYRFNRDRTFLAERAWPALAGAAEFFLDYLAVDPATNQLVSGPSSSPENRFRTADGQVADTCMGAAMDQEIVWDLFTNVLAAAAELGRRDAFVERVRTARERLAWPAIGADGRLLEWPHDADEVEPGHRHLSHLFGLHPGAQFTSSERPDHVAAARASLDFRLAHGGGHTGWSRAWIVNFFARLEDGDGAHEHLALLLRSSTLPNLFDDHPPFQIDGNFGGTAGIAAMLLSSHDEIRLLPALPTAWPRGSVRGLRARGGITVDLAWVDGQLDEAVLRADRSASVRVHCGEASWSLDLDPDRPTVLRPDRAGKPR